MSHYRDFKDSIVPEVKLSDRFCARPFERVEIMHGAGAEQKVNPGDVYVCCSGWLSKKIGNYSNEDLATLWNSEAAQEIRKSILDGSFRYCNSQACPQIQNKTLPRKEALSSKYKKIIEENRTIMQDLPESYYLCYDRSCNLSCPSCRSKKLLFTQGDGFNSANNINQKLMRDVFSQPHDRHINLKITGSGDPFASPVFRELIASLDGSKFPGLVIELFTNGVLFTPRNWEQFKNIHKHVRMVSVSIDAATASTYKLVRGGNWNQLLANMDFIGSLAADKVIQRFETNYVVQTANFFEVPDFVRLCKEKNVDAINFSFVSDWGTWSKDVYREQCIWRIDHPQFPRLIEVLKDPVMSDKIARLGPLREYVRQAQLQ